MAPTLNIHVVRPGDTLTRIAKQHGVADWRTIYYAPENTEFRASGRTQTASSRATRS